MNNINSLAGAGECDYLKLAVCRSYVLISSGIKSLPSDDDSLCHSIHGNSLLCRGGYGNGEK